MRRACRLLGWITLLGLLAGVGVPVYFHVRHRPRVEFGGRFKLIELAGDGSKLVTESLDAGDQGLIRVWDAHSGSALSFFVSGPVTFPIQWQLSRNRRILAVNIQDGRIHVIDWQSGSEQTVDIGNSAGTSLQFSDDSQWLFVKAPIDIATDRGHVVINVPEHRVVMQGLRGDLLGFGLSQNSICFRHGWAGTVTVWSLSTGQKTNELKVEAPYAKLLPDDRTLLIGMHRLALRRMSKFCLEYELLDLVTGEKRGPQKHPDGFMLSWAAPLDKHHLLVTGERNETEWHFAILEIATGQATPCVKCPEFVVTDVAVRGQLVCLYSEAADRTAVYDLFSRQILWTKQGSLAAFVGNEDFAFIRLPDLDLEFLDGRTGACHMVAPYFFEWRVNDKAPFAVHGPYCLMRDTRQFRRAPRMWESWVNDRWPNVLGIGKQTAVVFEISTGTDCFRMPLDLQDQAFLSDDASTLVIVDEKMPPAETTIRIYDVHPHRAWTWALAVSAGAGLGLWGLRRGVRRLRRRSVEPKQQSA